MALSLEEVCVLLVFGLGGGGGIELSNDQKD